MRVLVFLLALALALSAVYVEKGVLQFQVVNSPYQVDGKFLLYIYQPLCEECRKLEAIFAKREIAAAMSGYNLYALDLSKSAITAVDVYIGGQVVYVDHGVVKYFAATGRRTFIIPGTPTILVGVRENETVRLLGFWTGADMPPGEDLEKAFIRFLDEVSGSRGAVGETYRGYVLWVLPLAFVMGVLSAFSPCVLPVLGVVAVTHFAKRSLGKVLAGMVISYATIGALIAIFGAIAASARYLIIFIGGVLLILLGAALLVERLNIKYATVMSRIQSSAFKRLARAGDFLIGASLGAVWIPCILPYIGFATVLALTSLAGDYLMLLATMLFYGAGLAFSVYAIVKGLFKRLSPSRGFEKAVGIMLIIVGLYLVISLWV